MTHLTKLALLNCLRNAFAKDFFDIGGVARACEIVGRPIYEDTLDWHTMRGLHCADWADFDAQSKSELLETCARVLGISFSVIKHVQIGQGASLPATT